MASKYDEIKGRKLKRYDEYLQKLELYAEASGIKIEYAVNDSDGVYLPIKRIVRVDPDLPESVELAVILHELGHSLDDSLTSINQHRYRMISRAYVAFYNEKATHHQKNLVMGCEERAWANGRAIAKQVRIPLGKWFDEMAKSYLRLNKE